MTKTFPSMTLLQTTMTLLMTSLLTLKWSCKINLLSEHLHTTSLQAFHRGELTCQQFRLQKPVKLLHCFDYVISAPHGCSKQWRNHFNSPKEKTTECKIIFMGHCHFYCTVLFVFKKNEPIPVLGIKFKKNFI